MNAFARILSNDGMALQNTILNEMKQVLNKEFKSWYPLSIDSSFGGFFSDLDYRWKLNGRQDKMIVTQARHIWSASNAAMFYQRDNYFRNIAKHGVMFLKNTMWDKEYGGFYDLVTRDGEPKKEEDQIVKRVYGQAFAIYGLAAYFKISHDSLALSLAQDEFRWIEKHSYDPKYDGYFQFISREGIPFKDGWGSEPPKDYNSSIHLLECLTELYKIWPDSIVKVRLESMLHLIRDSLVTNKGYIKLFFKQDWTPISYRDSSAEVREKNYFYDHISFGHDIEIAYLMLEASEALGLKQDTITLAAAKKLVDHVLQFGMDEKNGGIYDGGYYLRGDQNPIIIKKSKEWWSQAEALNSLLMMSELFPDDNRQYFLKFVKQWEYCKNYVIDQVNGGWYWGGIDVEPDLIKSPKSSIWKGNYHTSRAIINCINRLNHETLSTKQERYNPVNKNATAEARKLLELLYSIKGNKIIAGHHNYIDKPDMFIHRIKELTGRSPEIWGCDFINYYKNGEAEKIVQEAYKKYKEGYIITLMWHAGRPQDDPPFGWKESIQAKLTDEQWKELITRGTKLHNRCLAQMDIVAGYLKELQQMGVPILWRPYHELNGVWFWWGNRKGAQGSAALYKMMFDRFVNYHKLNNLIWVWNTNAPRQLVNDEAYDYEDFFPGLDYVDVLATDIYHNDYRQNHHDELFRLGQGKIISLGEVGEMPSPEILDRQPMWTWFMEWADFVDTHNSPQQVMALYGYHRILTFEDFINEK